MDCDQICKFQLVGKEMTGKTSIMNRYMESTFTDRYITTIGINQKSTELMIDRNRSLLLQIWDQAGKQKLRKTTTSYMNGINVFLVVFDLTEKSSFEAAIEHISAIRAKKPNIAIVLIGNKSDLEQQRNVEQDDIDALLKQNSKIQYVSCSAKEDKKIMKIFEVGLAMADLQ